MDKQDEFDFLVQYAQTFSLSAENFRNQLKSLWTAFCLHQWVYPDDSECDVLSARIWERVHDCDKQHFGSFNSFCRFLKNLSPHSRDFSRELGDDSSVTV
jgi:hypothetical protein